jgi:hypothetical protein
MWTMLFLVPVLAFAGHQRPRDLPEKVSESDFIVMAKAKAVDQRFSFEPGMQQLYADMDVTRTIKGRVPRRIKLITSGFTPAWNPWCCRAGAEYLIFGKFGFPIFVVGEDMDVLEMRQPDEYVSSADGPFGVFLVVGERTLTDWNMGGHKKADVERVISRIKATEAEERNAVKGATRSSGVAGRPVPAGSAVPADDRL